MIESNKTAREIWHDVFANNGRVPFGFGKKAALINIDLQHAYTRTDLYKTAYETDPKQLEHIANLSVAFRKARLPVVYTNVSYLESAEDAGVWGTRTDTPDSLQNIKYGSDRAEIDARAGFKPETDVFYTKRMPSAFFETPLQSLLVWHQVDTLILTGGSTSGCIRATAIDSLSRGYRTIVPMECVADKHESYHFANLTDLHLKYADVVTTKAVHDYLAEHS